MATEYGFPLFEPLPVVDGPPPLPSWSMPTDYNDPRVLSGYGLREKPNAKASSNHKGWDVTGATGGAISGAGAMAASGGRVSYVGPKGNYGQTVIVDHPGGTQTLYGHLDGFAPGLRVGDEVTTGQQIGVVGNTGNSTGPHLHFEVRQNGVAVNPEALGYATSWPSGGGRQAMSAPGAAPMAPGPIRDIVEYASRMGQGSFTAPSTPTAKPDTAQMAAPSISIMEVPGAMASAVPDMITAPPGQSFAMGQSDPLAGPAPNAIMASSIFGDGRAPQSAGSPATMAMPAEAKPTGPGTPSTSIIEKRANAREVAQRAAGPSTRPTSDILAQTPTSPQAATAGFAAMTAPQSPIGVTPQGPGPAGRPSGSAPTIANTTAPQPQLDGLFGGAPAALTAFDTVTPEISIMSPGLHESYGGRSAAQGVPGQAGTSAPTTATSGMPSPAVVSTSGSRAVPGVPGYSTPVSSSIPTVSASAAPSPMAPSATVSPAPPSLTPSMSAPYSPAPGSLTQNAAPASPPPSPPPSAVPSVAPPSMAPPPVSPMRTAPQTAPAAAASTPSTVSPPAGNYGPGPTNVEGFARGLAPSLIDKANELGLKAPEGQVIGYSPVAPNGLTSVNPNAGASATGPGIFGMMERDFGFGGGVPQALGSYATGTPGRLGGGILGGVAGTALGGPVGGLVGSLAGGWLGGRLSSGLAAQNAAASLGQAHQAPTGILGGLFESWGGFGGDSGSGTTSTASSGSGGFSDLGGYSDITGQGGGLW